MWLLEIPNVRIIIQTEVLQIPGGETNKGNPEIANEGKGIKIHHKMGVQANKQVMQNINQQTY